MKRQVNDEYLMKGEFERSRRRLGGSQKDEQE